jgi:FecR protein
LLLQICFVVTVAVAGAAVAQDAMEGEASIPPVEASVPRPEVVAPPGRVGRLSLRSDSVSFRPPGQTGWTDAEVNQPVFAGAAIRTGPRSRAEIQIGANAIYLSSGAEIEITSLTDRLTQIALSRGRIALRLRRVDAGETAEIDVPQGGIWLLGPGMCDIDAASGDQPARVAVFAGTAHFIGAGGDNTTVEAGRMAGLTGPDAAAATIEPATPDDFVEWSRGRDYDETRLPALYYTSPNMTGFAELDAAGIWKINSEYGPVWFPTESEEWSPYRFGHWSWIAPWGWTWIDDQPWGFAPSHYGRWAMIDEHWAWVPGGFAAHPLFAPAVVAFLGTPGIGLSSEDGAAVAWFPLAPGEAYWPSYTRDVDYVRSLNLGSVRDVETIGLQADGEPPLEVFSGVFVNRQFASVVPRSIFLNGGAAAPARLTLPERRLLNAPVLMGSPQIAPASAQPVARAAPMTVNAAVTAHTPVSRVAVRLSPKGGAKAIHTASMAPRSHGQPMIIRAAHLRAPSYAGQTHGRQLIVLLVAVAHNPRNGAAKGAQR